MASASVKYLDYYELDGGTSLQFYIWPTKKGVIKFATQYFTCFNSTNLETPNTKSQPKSCYWILPHRVPYRCALAYLKVTRSNTMIDSIEDEIMLNTQQKYDFLTSEHEIITTEASLEAPLTRRNRSDHIIIPDSQPIDNRLPIHVVPLPQNPQALSQFLVATNPPALLAKEIVSPISEKQNNNENAIDYQDDAPSDYLSDSDNEDPRNKRARISKDGNHNSEDLTKCN